MLAPSGWCAFTLALTFKTATSALLTHIGTFHDVEESRQKILPQENQFGTLAVERLCREISFALRSTQSWMDLEFQLAA